MAISKEACLGSPIVADKIRSNRQSRAPQSSTRFLVWGASTILARQRRKNHVPKFAMENKFNRNRI